jgi:hypothetical protein
MSTLLSTSLSKAGYNCNFPRKALHGPPSFMGGDVHHIYATMVAKHVQEMMTEAPQDSPTGQLIRTSIEQAKLELGLAGRLFDHDFKTVGHLITECWIKNLWKETSAYGFRLIEQMGSLKPECEGDKMLMEAIIQTGYKGRELRDLTKCRLYLQCSNLADITNGKGNKILAAAIQCHRSALIERKQYKWPIQPAPNQLQKLLWRKALHKCFTLNHRTNVRTHHPAISSNTTQATECTMSQQAMEDGNKSKRTHSDSNKIPLGLHCKSPQKNHAHKAS